MNEIKFPAEYSPHHATIAMLPFRNDIWRNNAHNMQNYMLNLVKTVSAFELVYLVYDERCNISERELQFDNVIPIKMKYDDIWARDISPTFVYIDGRLTCLNWKFNAWGGKNEGAYYPWDDDNEFAINVARYLNLPVINIPLTLEGGAIISDGHGTVFTTRSVLLNRNRNPFKSKQYVETILKNQLGAKNIIWLKQGLATDETNGHIDNVLSVISDDEICIAWTDDKQNKNYKRVRCILEVLQNEYNGIIHKINLPASQYMTEEEAQGIVSNPNALPRNAGDLLPASYLNFYFVNGGVIVPVFNCSSDQDALNQFEKIFPDKKIVPVYSREPLLGGGGIHCLLHEIPDLEDNSYEINNKS